VNGSAKQIECIHGGNPGGCYWADWGGLFEDGFESGDSSHWSFAALGATSRSGVSRPTAAPRPTS